MRRATLVLTSAISGLLVTSGADWPQWRGPNGQGISPEADFPTVWSETQNVAWKSEIPGRGHSSPIVWGDRVFLTTSIEGAPVDGAKAVKHFLDGEEFVHPESVGADRRQSLKVLCVDRDSGRILWDRIAYDGLVYDSRHRQGSFAAPTSVTDGRRVYSYFGSEGVCAHELDGREAWKASVGQIGTLGLGPGTSPVLYEQRLFLQCDEDGGDKSFIVALEAESGQVAWRAGRDVPATWATPLILEGAKAPELFCAGSNRIVAYDPRTGREVWSCPGLESNTIHSPVADSQTVFATAGYPKKRVLALRRSLGEPASETPRVAWEYGKGTAYVASPILYEGRLYLVSDRGVVTCLDARTGAVQYDDLRVPRPGRFTASPVAFGGNVLFTSEEGDTFVVRAGARAELLATNSLGEAMFASPALSQGRIFLRGVRHLYCLRVSGA